MRLIDADALVEDISKEIDEDKEIYPDDKSSIIFRAGMKTVIGIVKKQDTVEPVKHGRWIFAKDVVAYLKDIISYIKCSECGDDICWVNTKRPKYCPNCGARMDGEDYAKSKHAD